MMHIRIVSVIQVDQMVKKKICRLLAYPALSIFNEMGPPGIIQNCVKIPVFNNILLHKTLPKHTNSKVSFQSFMLSKSLTVFHCGILSIRSLSALNWFQISAGKSSLNCSS